MSERTLSRLPQWASSGSEDKSRWVHLRRGEGQDLVLRAAAHAHLLRGQILAAFLLSAVGVRQPEGSTYRQGIDPTEIIETVHVRRPPMMPASAALEP